MAVNPQYSVQGQLSSTEKKILVEYLLKGDKPPQIAIEVGTWLGGGSTLHILRELIRQGEGHLWGIEADKSIYEAMLSNIKSALPNSLSYFTPIFGFSQKVLPGLIRNQSAKQAIDFVFLDGGDSPSEQVDEFEILDPSIVVGGRVVSHDAKLRKGKWFVPYIMALDHYESKLHDVSDEGLLTAIKTRDFPSVKSKANAQRILRRLRQDPVEFLGRISPRWALRLASKILPAFLVRRVGQGRN
jgi:predicted O-methyltransferase YrrM